MADLAKELLVAVKHADQAAVKRLLEAGADASTPGLLHAATKKGDLVVATRLKLAGAEPNLSMRSSRRTPLCEAVAAGETDMVLLLLSWQAETSGALDLAARGGQQELVEMLLSAGADVHHRVSFLTPVKQAAYKGHLGCLRALLAAGGDPDCVYAAAGRVHKDIVHALLDAGGQATPYALEMAVERGHLAIVELLLERGVKPDAATMQKVTNPAILRALVRGGADVKDVPCETWKAFLDEHLALTQSVEEWKATPFDLQEAVVDFARDMVRPAKRRRIGTEAMPLTPNQPLRSANTGQGFT